MSLQAGQVLSFAAAERAQVGRFIFRLLCGTLFYVNPGEEVRWNATAQDWFRVEHLAGLCCLRPDDLIQIIDPLRAGEPAVPPSCGGPASPGGMP